MRVAYGRVGVRGGPLSVFIARVKGGPRPTVITDRAPDQGAINFLNYPVNYLHYPVNIGRDGDQS